MKINSLRACLMGVAVLAYVLLSCNILKAQSNNPNDILGIWLSDKKDTKIKISQTPDGTYQGVIIWVEPQYEQYNGQQVMRGVSYNPQKNEYYCPWIYSPRLNMAAHAIFTLENDNNELHAKVQKAFISIGENFTRVQE